MTPEEASATVTLLRAPAALGAAAFLVGAVAGEAVMWTGRSPGARPAAAVSLVAVAFVCVPFLLPSDWYGRRRRAMQVWMIAAAAAASLRGVYLAAVLYSTQSATDRIVTAAVELAIAGILWAAVAAVRWRAGAG
jgi:hypothetical protein